MQSWLRKCIRSSSEHPSHSLRMQWCVGCAGKWSHQGDWNQRLSVFEERWGTPLCYGWLSKGSHTGCERREAWMGWPFHSSMLVTWKVWVALGGLVREFQGAIMWSSEPLSLCPHEPWGGRHFQTFLHVSPLTFIPCVLPECAGLRCQACFHLQEVRHQKMTLFPWSLDTEA
jgi:hypothetical protein